MASLVRIAGVSARPVTNATSPKPSAADCDTPPGRNSGCAWHCMAADAGSSVVSPSAAAASARRRAWAWAAVRTNCSAPDATIAQRCAGQ
eukprot:scaffold13744_cov63-Phaeocystis_antarctica.AAC.4